MIEIVVPPDWSPATDFRDLSLASFVIAAQPGRFFSWYEIGARSDGPDPRYNLSKPLGLKPCRVTSIGADSPTS